MKLKVIDNFINDQEVINRLYNFLLFECPHFLVEYGDDTDGPNGSVIFYSTDFSLDEPFVSILYYRMLDFLGLNSDEYEIVRIHANIQHHGMGLHADYHQDSSTFTGVYFVSPDVEGGQFETEDQIIDYVQDRLLIFDGSTKHRGLPPTNFTARVSLAFKVRKK